MHRIDSSTATPDNRFTEGDPMIPVPATTVTAGWLNSVQEEMVRVITEAGLELDKTDTSQLWQAIVKIIGVEVPLAEVGTPGIMSPDGKTCTVDARGVLSVLLATAARAGLVKPDGVTITIEADGTISAVQPTMKKYDLCEFYYFRHPTLKPGFQPAQGGLLANAATLYPEAWAYLQTTEGKKLCKTEAQWQALTTATWATLADGTKVGWNGIGGAPFYAPNTATGALRLPDLRGMYAEAAGFDSLSVGGAQGDQGRKVYGAIDATGHSFAWSDRNITGAFALRERPGASGGNVFNAHSSNYFVDFDSARIQPVGSANAPRRWGALACCYLGTPAS
ncbi:MAG: hypothetical protein KH208_14735 [Desulfovibrio sp.]|uniref:hypothetical protein n=1 Tax=Desulfovibrio sp. TaxID=885 RepID=UPI0025C3BCA9|nr:hypothetical protein [Desulfovibrio sp.]MBS6831085.1 hypothetical protein [Desulfovibrio sp.]